MQKKKRLERNCPLSAEFLRVAEPCLLCSHSTDQLITPQLVNAPCEHAYDPDIYGLPVPWSKAIWGNLSLLTHWLAVMCSVSVIIKWFLCSSVGVISPQDAVTAERDVMENYHLHRPRALECSPASSPIPPQEERDRKQKHKLRVNEVLEGGTEGGEAC